MDSDRPNIIAAAAAAAVEEKEDQKISKVGVLTLQQTIAALNSGKIQNYQKHFKNQNWLMNY